MTGLCWKQTKKDDDNKRIFDTVNFDEWNLFYAEAIAKDLIAKNSAFILDDLKEEQNNERWLDD